jgi:hypothetical protein
MKNVPPNVFLCSHEETNPQDLILHEFTADEKKYICKEISQYNSKQAAIEYFHSIYNILKSDIEEWLVTFDLGDDFVPSESPLDDISTRRILPIANDHKLMPSVNFPELLKEEMRNTSERKNRRSELIIMMREKDDTRRGNTK